MSIAPSFFIGWSSYKIAYRSLYESNKNDLSERVQEAVHIAKVIDERDRGYPFSSCEVVILITNGTTSYDMVFFSHMNKVFNKLNIDRNYHITEDHSNQNTVDFILTIF